MTTATKTLLLALLLTGCAEVERMDNTDVQEGLADDYRD